MLMMKKRVLMMMLAGVLAFSMIGCGGGSADQEDPDNDQQIVDTENNEEEGEDTEKDETEGEEGKGEEDPSQNGGGSIQTPAETSKPVSGQPGEQKPSQQKPAEQKPAQTQKPAKPSGSGAGSSGAAGEGSGSSPSEKPAATDLSSMTLEDIITKSYGDLELPVTEAKEVDASDANLMEWYFGTTDITFKRAVASEAMISSIAHSVIAVEAEDGADVEALAKKIKDNANVRKWVCVEPGQVGVAYRGNIILFAMSGSADDILENFKAL